MAHAPHARAYDSPVHKTAQRAAVEHPLSAPCAVRLARAVAALSLPQNVVFLGGRDTLLRDGVLFVGACAWWDFAFCAPECEPEEARKHFRRAACDELCVARSVCCSVCALTACWRHCVLLPHVSLPGSPGCAVGKARTGC
jgi:hypothetical protein